MIKRLFKPAKGVSNIELFYDLIFVYAISTVTSLCREPEGSFLDLNTWLIYMFSLLVILQVWNFTTLLMNRYSDRSLSESTCLFINMFLLYFLANGVQRDWQNSSLIFSLTWAGILVNLAVQWLIKLRTYSNIDDIDQRVMRWSARSLLVEAGIAVLGAFLPGAFGAACSWAALVFGVVVCSFSKLFRRKPARFNHVTERCSLLTIIAFGEMVVGISTYMTKMNSVWFPIGVFALTVGLFLIYIFEHDHMLDHDAHSDGIAYMNISLWLIVVIGNLTIAMQYMPMEGIDHWYKSVFLAACLVAYLLSSFLLGRYNKPEFRHSKFYATGRLTACTVIVVVGALTSFDPAVNLACHVVSVYAAFAHEWVLWRRGAKLIEYGRRI